MSNDAKRYNEILKDLTSSSAAGKRPLRAPQPLWTHCSHIHSWETVIMGCSLNEAKGFVPKEPLVPPLISAKTETEYIAAVLDLLNRVSSVTGPDGILVHLDVPDGNEDETKTLENRAKHLCGGHLHLFEKQRAQYAGCIVETLRHAALIAEQGSNRFYLRRYSKGLLHIVITTGRIVTEQAFQRSCDLVTQYVPKPVKAFNQAKVIFKNPATAKGK